MSALVVFGANGATGQVIVEEALRAGHTVTAAVRDPAAFRQVSNAPLKVVRADIRDLDSVRAAVTGHDAVISAIGPAGRKADGLYSSGARTLVAAMVASGIDRLVALSSSGARKNDPNHPLWYRVVARTLIGELYGDMRLMEDIVRDSPLDWTFVRPARIVDEPPTGVYRVEDGVNPIGGTSVTRADLARFVVHAVDDKRWSRSFPTIAR
ncbi:putative NADH-flavin reductase [Kibdelosporangium banguiense]|uniref:NADH-flavin reductase n=1 Tax=Kibdelosporangium banguiense TaxID=1365924 RepID=A0ABS4U0G5_9PSEU|nr:SDR family oxidoreductase [Kibdelosporangium banguiense]MBP2330149.1 putative NADH-flavin reductase [Kibdelosporangium banguiense]